MAMDTSYLSQQVTTIIGQLHGLFDEIGVPNHERDSREAELFSALSETLNNQLKLVNAEKNEKTEEAQRLIKTIRQLEASLEGRSVRASCNPGDEELQITYPLARCIQNLKEKHKSLSRQHRERFEQVKKLAQALESYASHLEPSFLQIKLPPASPSAKLPPTFDVSPSYVASLDKEFSRVYEEYTRRVGWVQDTADEVIKLWAELGTPQAQTDSDILEFAREAPEQLGLHQDDLDRLRARKDKLVEEKAQRERRLRDLRSNIEALWDRLGVEQPDRKAFLASSRGCGMRAINEFEDELARLNELKRQNLHLFVEDARDKLQQLWDSLYFSEEEMLDFTPAFSDVYSDALLSAHEAEIDRLEALREQRAPILALLDKHKSLLQDRDELNASAQDASRLMGRGQKGERRDPGKLLREEKMRKRIAKELPKVETELRSALEAYEDEYGRPFLVQGERYLDELETSSSTRAVPPRSKTPSAGSTSQRPTLHKHSKSASSLARGGTISRAGSVRGGSQAPPSRAKTPVSTNFSQSTASFRSNADYSIGSISRGHNPLAASVSSNGSVRSGSPTKIPGRAPLRHMKDGNNSIEDRRYQPGKDDSTIRANSTIRGNMAPPRAPPPKMKDLFSPPSEGNSYDRDNFSDRSSIVRSVPPEDPYDDRSFMSFVRPDSGRGSYPPMAPPPARSDSRQTSTTSSTAHTAQSGSENWETYSDVSEPEPDASEAYYAKLRANHMKRYTPELNGTHRKSRPAGGIRGVGHTESMVEYEDGRIMSVDGSDAGWTDDNETY
ncbi:Microtubule-associated protein MAP65/ASE1-type [Macrophomina phaseolina MS6]|uniref:Microtubule-associated protein MAP65/ASE1-type n=1 Tax=Macrophomina phaseolina (strain MS6) TaxID=1126212 RepID=K2RLS1_MACPH|nr:Microtubule-associated protein MAP65/ASE1-type [Macrophomina phaseolina MS6]